MKSIDKKLSELSDRLQRLKNLSSTIQSFEEYSRSTDKKDIAERNLQTAIEACLDISKIIISEKKFPEPSDYKGLFTVLAEQGIINQDNLKFLIPMAGTRNILVHGYDRVDDSLIYGMLKKHLNDFSKFIAEIKSNYLGNA